MAARYQPDQQAYPQPSNPTQPQQMRNVPERYRHPDPPPQSDLPPSYHVKLPPNTATTATVVVTGQPTSTTTSSVSPPANTGNILATCALVLSAVTMICCGAYLIFLSCIIPAFILAIMARGSTGTKQKTNAAISIVLNVAVISCVVLFVIVFTISYSTATANSRNRYYQYRRYNRYQYSRYYYYY